MIAVDCSDPRLLSTDDPLWLELQRTMARDDDPLPLLREELAAFCGMDAPVALFDDVASARARAIRAVRGASDLLVLCVGSRIEGVDGRHETIDFTRLAEAPSRILLLKDLGLVVLEPRGELALLRAVAEAASRRGARLILDESRTAGRLTARTVGEETGILADAVLLGDTLATKGRFAAIVGIAEPQSRCGAATAIGVRATLRRLAGRGVHEELSRIGVAVRARFVAACRRHGISARLLGPAALMRLHVDEQDNLSGARIVTRLIRELAAFGVAASHDLCVPAHLGAEAAESLGVAVERSLASLRTRIVEHNAVVSVDLPFVLDDRAGNKRAVQLARFLHPRQVAGKVEAAGDRIWLRLDAGPLGPGATAGFSMRTPLTGDFAVSVRIALGADAPGGDGAQFALFVHDRELGTRTQAVCVLDETLDRAHLLATFGGEPEGGHLWSSPRGWLRVERRGDAIAIAVADDGDDPDALSFVEIARRRPVPKNPVVAGCRISAAVHTGGLRAEITALRMRCDVDGTSA